MALTLKTPGVYLEEQSSFPPSVAQVATAIPAFIGFTEKATKKAIGDLDMVPMRITSMLEYETYFGKALNETNIKVFVTEGVISPQLSPNERKPYLMYYALQMYFANGGGPCYIVSTGDYSEATPDFDKLKAGLEELEKQDEPTLIYFSDGISLSSGDLYSLNNLALQQCVKLQDRFTVVDTQMSDVITPDVSADIATFRGAISADENELKYGAAYYPYLSTILDYQYIESEVTVNISSAGSYNTQAQNVVSTSVVPSRLVLAGHQADLIALNSNVTTPPPGRDAFSYKSEIRQKVLQIIGTSNSLINSMNDIVTISNSVPNPDPALTAAITSLENWITTNLVALSDNLTDDLATLDAAEDSTDVLAAMTDIMASTASDVAQLITTEILAAGEIMPDLIAELALVSSVTVVKTLAQLMTSDNVLYNRVKLALSDMPVVLPPGPSVLGIYAKTDANEGVWKAPANTSLNFVLGPVAMISNGKQEDMNVDVVAGKSVNAIRSFTGRGTLVWGARTLDGNSNEWRYISVRRFYNFAEESIKKATEGFVFEGNDANTWTQVRAMIESFLVLQWKAGALAGAKPEQAFFVRVGLGQTMTADDVLAGRMIVEIGMAVVRPAEFIILRFSHMMQQS